VSESPTSYPAIDLSQDLPNRVDLLKLDIEGAEFQILDRLCETQAIQRFRKLICEFHVCRKTPTIFSQRAYKAQRHANFTRRRCGALHWCGK
jgi:hypothetical protein